MRRLPKKLLMSFFCSDQDHEFPKDEVLVDMVKQTERWEGFRKGMWLDCVGTRHDQFWVNGAPRSTRDSALSSMKKSVRSKKEFLGADDGSSSSDEGLVLGSPRRGRGVLTEADTEYLSGSSSKFINRMQSLEGDKGLKGALLRDGHQGRRERTEEESQRDPYQHKAKRFWARLQKDPIVFDDEDDFGLDPTVDPVTEASASVSWGASCAVDRGDESRNRLQTLAPRHESGARTARSIVQVRVSQYIPTPTVRKSHVIGSLRVGALSKEMGENASHSMSPRSVKGNARISHFWR